jgi:hypothetical protein
MFARSANGGLSFSAPQRINDVRVNPSKWHWFGTFSVAPIALKVARKWQTHFLILATKSS